AFPLDDNIQIAWLLQKSEDKSLSGFIGAFFQRLKNEGSLERMRNLYYGHVQKMNYVGARTFIQHIETRLPQFQDTFQKAAEELGLDWRLLAAIAYQESHWNESAVSPTGVRGLMMLTQATAEEMGVKDRLNPAESILGGARYFSKIHARMPERISEPDRTWLTLAAYNVGYGHLEDARVLTQNGGKNPDAWSDVREHLPLLAKKKWHAQSKHGFARGEEPVNYVRNVRRYYDVLVWMGGAQEGKPPKNQLAEEESTPKLKLDAKLPISEMPPTL
ncbi:MAG: membrane-bound lytic murein transglycosylase MltF, partial [Bdellovibrionales bacterium]|nr:membrane-bound lytic murein transglycosylase MltF [Bdellovibrionales bacterium]